MVVARLSPAHCDAGRATTVSGNDGMLAQGLPCAFGYKEAYASYRVGHK